MRINKLTASFGKLENKSISFTEGLNIVHAPNESGKSTWCAFIRAMLYGVDSSERAKAGFLPDKQRYAPWSGAPMEGLMELTVDGRDISISRSTRAKNAPMREFSATYTGTNTAVEGLTGTNAGEALTGVSKDVFRRSAFVEQGAVAVSGSSELEKRIMSIVSTGEEKISYSEADEQLRAWQRKRRHNRRGMLPELEAKIEDTRLRLEQMESFTSELSSLNSQLEQAKAEHARLEQLVAESRKQQRRETLENLNTARSEFKLLSEKHDADLTRLNSARETLRMGDYAFSDPQQYDEQARADIDECERLDAVIDGKRAVSPVPAVIAAALTLAALVAAFLLKPLLLFIAVGVIFAAAAILLFGRYRTAQRLIKDSQELKKSILLGYGASSIEDILARGKEFAELYAAVLSAEDAEKHSRAELETAQRRLTKLEQDSIDDLNFTDGNSHAAQLGRSMDSAGALAERLAMQIASLNGRISASGDPLVLESDLDFMRQKHAQLSAEYEALALAVDTMREADAELQSRFSPELGRLASQYLSQMTGGRYADMLINRDFSIKARLDGDILPHESEYLSAGTLDLMYLALRLAVCRLALPEGKNCPLIIDDALVNLDAERYELAMGLLEKIAETRQVILFTCRK